MSYQQSFSYVGTVLHGLNQYLARINVSCSRTQRSDAGEALTSGPLVSSQALYHWATARNVDQQRLQVACKRIGQSCASRIYFGYAGDKETLMLYNVTLTS